MTRNVMDADANHRHHGGDTGLVPAGLYCYRTDRIEYEADGRPRMKITTCPYWGSRQIDDATFGYCAHLKTGDWEDDGTMLLHDMVKECGINTGDDEPENGGTH
ncbi:hypothetical protein [Rhizobium sp. BK176]|uniref:hypothetical protein n=1 Tax=Rhizobium sp. BK176 TaxID=2587071 RepID=UPI002169E75D|nr:hypothetical protein [Rhizobium sp. BK176]MCS4090014.1 hypothetical protein [Rhizobium sp. BK176]